MSSRSIACVLVMFLLLPLSFILPGSGEGTDTLPAYMGTRSAVRYSSSTPIRINSDADFTSTPAVSGGDGSPEDPWIIEGLEVNGSGHGYGIFIGNTTDHFILRDCFVHHADGNSNDYYWNVGVLIINVKNGSVHGNTVEHSGSSGIYSRFSENVGFTDNDLFDNPNYGLILDHDEYCTITGNNASRNGNCGLSLQVCDHCNVSGNTAMGNILRSGITIYMSEYNDVNDNIVSGNLDDGIYVQVSSRNNFVGNQVIKNANVGINIYSSSINNYTMNTICYNNLTGIRSYQGTQNNISMNNCSFNTFNGIHLENSFGNLILENRLSKNKGNGIYATNSHSNSIHNNDLSGNGDNGVLLSSGANDNTVLENSIRGNEFGILLTESSNNNTFGKNNISKNLHGIRISDSNDNTVYHNTFRVNTYQGFDAGTGNRWYGDYPIGGNYWSDHTGDDQFNGPEQDTVGPDGIIDIAYDGILGSAGTKDRYPLYFPDINGADVTPPSSSMDDREDYWCTGPVYLIMSASDLNSGVNSVELWYRYSDDVLPWTTWEKYSMDTVREDGWSLEFKFPDGEGYYEFFSIATDLIGHREASKPNAELQCGYDTTAPTLNDGTSSSAGTGEVFQITVSVSDNLVLDHVGLSYRFGSGNLTNLTMDGTNNSYLKEMDIPSDSCEPLLYIISALDAAGNINMTPETTVNITDILPPIASAGPDLTVDQGTVVTFNSSGSTDNIGIMKFTWAFPDGAFPGVLIGPSPSYLFDIPGVYTITLFVHDHEGNNATDQLVITVIDTMDPVADAGPDLTVNIGDPVIMDGSGSHDNVGITSYSWSFNDGVNDVTLTGETASHTFSVAGNYTVTLTVEDAAGRSGLDTLFVRVTPAPVDDDEDDDDGSLITLLAILAILALLFIIIIIILLIVLIGKKGKGPEEE